MKMIHPKAIFIQLNEFCNASCISCPYSTTYGQKKLKLRMSDVVWYKILGDLKRSGYRNQIGFYLHFEPLTEKTLFKKIQEVNTQTKAFVVLSTNGALLTSKFSKKLIESRPAKVHININSADPDQYRTMMGLDFNEVLRNTKDFIKRVGTRFSIEINCPVQKGVDIDKLVNLFSGTYVNTKYWANSRGGLVKGILKDRPKITRFNEKSYCRQPSQNLNILVDGSIVVCCQDWAHESKKDFSNVLNVDVFEIYRGKMMKKISEEFKRNNYSRYKMCQICSREMGWSII